MRRCTLFAMVAAAMGCEWTPPVANVDTGSAPGVIMGDVVDLDAFFCRLDHG